MYDYLLIDSLNMLYRVRGSKELDLSKLAKIGNKIIQTALMKEFITTMQFLESKYLSPKGIVYFLFDNATSRDELKKLFAPLEPMKSRKEVDKSYKEDRRPETKEFYNTLDLIKYYYMISGPRYKTARIMSLEADDLVKPCLQSIRREEPQAAILLVTNDSDWARYLDDQTHYLPHTYDSPVGPAEFLLKNGYAPSEEKIILHKVLFGDSADNVKEAIPELPTVIKKTIRDKFTSVLDFVEHCTSDPVISSYSSLIREKIPELRIAYQMVATIPVSEKSFFYNCTQGRESKVQLNAINNVMYGNPESNSFEFGGIKVPRVTPNE